MLQNSTPQEFIFGLYTFSFMNTTTDVQGLQALVNYLLYGLCFRGSAGTGDSVPDVEYKLILSCHFYEPVVRSGRT